MKVTHRNNQITVTNDKGRLSKGEINRMANETAKYEAQDRDQRKRVKAKDELQSYAYSMKNTINDTNVANKLEESDKQALSTAIEETLQWLTNNQDASKEEYEHHRKELEGKCKSILTKMYSTQVKLETIASYLCCNDDVSDSNCTNSVIFNFAASHAQARKAVMETLHEYNIPGLSIKVIKQKRHHKQNNHVIVNGSNNSDATNLQSVNATTSATSSVCVITLEWPGDSEDVPECLTSVAWWLLQQQHFYCCQEHNVDLHIKVSPGGHMGALPRPSDVINSSNNTSNAIATNANNVNCNTHVDWRLLYNSLHSFTIDMSDWSFGLDELQNAVNLQRITLRGTRITTLRWLKYCKEVRELTLDSCNALHYLDDVANLSKLNMFVATNCTFRNIAPLHVCKELYHLHLEDTTHTNYMEIINYMPHIKVLELTKGTSLVVDLDKLKELQELCTEGDVHITEAHNTLQVLAMKSAWSAIKVIDVMLPNLTKLVLEEFSITSLELSSISHLQHLKHLYIEASSEHTLTNISILNCMANTLQKFTLLNYTIVKTIVDNIVWHNITKLIAPGLIISDFNALRDCHHLTELDVQVKEEEMWIHHHYNSISHVKKLTLHCSKIHLQTLLSVCEELEVLTLDHCTVNATFTEPITVTVDNVQLCTLTLEECTGLQELSFTSIHNNLTQLRIVNCNELESIITATCCEEEQQEWQAEHITDAATEEEHDNNAASSTQTTTLLDHCPSLHNVNIEGCSKLQVIVMARIFQELMQEVKCNGGQIGVTWGLEGKYNATTHTLDVYDKSLSSVALSELAENVYTINVISSSSRNVLDSLDRFTQLQKLDISSYHCLTSVNLANPLDKLTTLIASHTALHDFHFLELMTNLTHLELDNCIEFTESNLLELLHDHTKLEVLSVQNTDITDFTIDSNNFTKLRYLNAEQISMLMHISIE